MICGLCTEGTNQHFFNTGALLSIVVEKILKMPPTNISAPGYSNTDLGYCGTGALPI